MQFRCSVDFNQSSSVIGLSVSKSVIGLGKSLSNVWSKLTSVNVVFVSSDVWFHFDCLSLVVWCNRVKYSSNEFSSHFHIELLFPGVVIVISILYAGVYTV
jgi:hypothetical protein